MDDIYSRAKEYAFKLLTFRPRTKKEIEDKLAGKNYPAEIIRQIVQMLENYNLVNDEEFAELWIRDRCKVRSYGRWRIKHELALKGIDRALIDEQVNRLISDEEEFEMARRLVEKREKPAGLTKEKFMLSSEGEDFQGKLSIICWPNTGGKRPRTLVNKGIPSS